MNRKSLPLISVIITNYNYGSYLQEAIESALKQSYKNTEIILIDDASADNSKEVYTAYSEEITIIEHEKNAGIVTSRNQALEALNGEFFCFLDADDVWPEEYLETLYTQMEEGSLDIVYADLKLFGDKNGKIELPSFSLSKIMDQNIINMGAMIRVSAVGENRFDEYLNRFSHEDWDFFLGMALKQVKIAKNNQVMLNYRLHDSQQQSRNIEKKREDEIVRLLKVNAYIIEKWRNKYPDLMDFTKDNQLVTLVTGLEGQVEQLKKRVEEHDIYVKDLEQQTQLLNNKLQETETVLENLVSSRSYKLAHSITRPLRAVRRLKHQVAQRRTVRQQAVQLKTEAVTIDAVQSAVRQTEKKHQYAVVLHLFYNDLWGSKFKDVLKNLYALKPFDLYVNAPNDADGVTGEEIKALFPLAQIVRLPNRGRDVLPFVIIFDAIKSKKYDAILKLHSKKSVHTGGGSSWLDSVLHGLVPKNKAELTQILEILKEQQTLVGMKSLFISLSAYFVANKAKIDQLTDGHLEDTNLDELGFFAGTMFWISGSYLEFDILDRDSFEAECGQTDGTYAHAFERYVAIQPQINGVPVYAIDNEGTVVKLSKRDIRQADEINDWEEFINEK